ncbi:VOC family protein [Streptomyces sp. NPDC101234]|uniref:VOC family protein n=1 Tax=Streptomyces sp. NPDC101234 TaxID=3366138 RepID=UPI0038221AF7
MQTAPGATTQFAFVTTDIDRAVSHWVDGLGAGPFYRLEFPVTFGERQYRGKPAEDSIVVALGFTGNTMIEIIQPTNDAPSVFQEVLREQGDLALHHVQPNIRPTSPGDYDAARARYEELRYDPALVMVLPGGGRCTIFDARSRVGSFVELSEFTADDCRGMEFMRAAHETWDGQRPIRDYAESATH